MSALPQSGDPGRPSVLVTGFSVFPGAPVNPTERLVAELERRRTDLERLCRLRTEVLAVDYQGLPQRLAALAREGCPDIALHFGLSAEAKGFALERVARNAVGVGRPDQAGFMPELSWIREGGEHLPTSLPVEAIHTALKAGGLPVDYSDDAGDYLCNYLFYHSRGALCAGFAPGMTGFIHVPPLEGQGGAMRMEQLVLGAETIIATCCREWRAAAAAGSKAQ